MLQLTVLHAQEEIVGFMCKLCKHMNPKVEPNSSVKTPRLIVICEKIMALTFFATIANTVIIVSTAAHQLDKWGLVGEISSVGSTMRPVMCLAFIVLHAYMGYILWSLTSFLALLFFATAFAVMASLKELVT